MTDDELKNLVGTNGAILAQHINDKIFCVDSFRLWNNDQMILGTACLAAGFARVEDMPVSDFLTLCRVAYENSHASIKEPPQPMNGDGDEPIH